MEKDSKTTVAVERTTFAKLDRLAKANSVSKMEYITHAINYFEKYGINPVEHEGSGRKAVSGMYTKTMRVPTVMEEEVLCLIDMYSNWLKSGKMEKGMARRTTPEQRKRAIRSIQEILEYEKQSQKVHKQEEEDKRQLSLF
jgi:hypothetical protein